MTPAVRQRVIDVAIIGTLSFIDMQHLSNQRRRILVPWQYSQRTGELTRDGRVIASGYSGNGVGRNNPGLEQARNIGPIPRGRYRIGLAHTHPGKGPVTMRLDPNGHLAHGRTAFLIHGDSRQHPGAASEGCIILGLDARRRIAASGDAVLEVVE